MRQSIHIGLTPAQKGYRIYRYKYPLSLVKIGPAEKIWGGDGLATPKVIHWTCFTLMIDCNFNG